MYVVCCFYSRVPCPVNVTPCVAPFPLPLSPPPFPSPFSVGSGLQSQLGCRPSLSQPNSQKTILTLLLTVSCQPPGSACSASLGPWKQSTCSNSLPLCDHRRSYLASLKSELTSGVEKRLFIFGMDTCGGGLRTGLHCEQLQFTVQIHALFTQFDVDSLVLLQLYSIWSFISLPWLPPTQSCDGTRGMIGVVLPWPSSPHHQLVFTGFHFEHSICLSDVHKGPCRPHVLPLVMIVIGLESHLESKCLLLQLLSTYAV